MSWFNARIPPICPVISVDEVVGRVKLRISNIVAFFSGLGFEFRSFDELCLFSEYENTQKKSIERDHSVPL